MLTLIFTILMFCVFGKLFVFAMKAAWGITKILFSIIFLPVTLIIMFCAGLAAFALPILIIIGIVVLIQSAAKV